MMAVILSSLTHAFSSHKACEFVHALLLLSTLLLVVCGASWPSAALYSVPRHFSARAPSLSMRLFNRQSTNDSTSSIPAPAALEKAGGGHSPGGGSAQGSVRSINFIVPSDAGGSATQKGKPVQFLIFLESSDIEWSDTPNKNCFQRHKKYYLFFLCFQGLNGKTQSLEWVFKKVAFWKHTLRRDTVSLGYRSWFSFEIHHCSENPLNSLFIIKSMNICVTTFLKLIAP